MKTFFQAEDYDAYLDFMRQTCRQFGVQILAYCLMPNHVHMVAVPETARSLTKAIGEAHERYTKRINYLRDWQGMLWQGRYFSNPMDPEYTASCVRYVELNPVRAGISATPGEYRWSSARAHIAGQDDKLVTVKPLLDCFPDWRSFLGEGLSATEVASIREKSRTGRPLGSAGFITELETMTGRRLTPRPADRGNRSNHACDA